MDIPWYSSTHIPNMGGGTLDGERGASTPTPPGLLKMGCRSTGDRDILRILLLLLRSQSCLARNGNVVPTTSIPPQYSPLALCRQQPHKKPFLQTWALSPHHYFVPTAPPPGGISKHLGQCFSFLGGGGILLAIFRRSQPLPVIFSQPGRRLIARTRGHCAALIQQWEQEGLLGLPRRERGLQSCTR